MMTNTATTNTNDFVVTVTTTEKNRHARAVFTWSWPGGERECDVQSFGFSDDELDAMIAARAHEGGDFAGHVVEF